MAMSEADRFLSDQELDNQPDAELLRKIRDQGERSGSHQVSPKGAKGIYQFMPKTGEQYGLSDPTDPVASTRAASKFVQDLKQEYMAKYPGKTEQEYSRMVAAHYNAGYAGGNAVAQGKQPPAQETQDYLSRIEGSTSEADRFLRENPEFGKPIVKVEVPQERLDTTRLQQMVDTPTTAMEKTRSMAAPLKQMGKDFVGGAKVSADAITRAITAGAYDPKLSTKDERSKYAGADIVGNLAGTAPYAFIPGGLAVQAPLMAGRAATQTLVEGGSGKEAAISGALEGAAGPVGKIAGAGVKLAGKAAQKVYTPVVEAIVRPSASRVDAGLMKSYQKAMADQEFDQLPELAGAILRQKVPDDVFSILANSRDNLGTKLRSVSPQLLNEAEMIHAASKAAKLKGVQLTKDNIDDFLGVESLGRNFELLGSAASKKDAAKNVVREMGQFSVGGAALGGGAAAVSGGDPLTGAIVGGLGGGGGIGALKASIARNALSTSPGVQKALLKMLPTSTGNREAFIQAARDAAEKDILKTGKRPAGYDSVLDDFGERAGKLYDDAMKKQLNVVPKSFGRTVSGATLIGTKAGQSSKSE